jgi:hypothetical protein
LLVVFLVFCIAGCQKQDWGLPDRDSVPRASQLPIDGYADVCPDGLSTIHLKVRIDCGRAIVLDAEGIKLGTVIIKDLAALDEHRYKGMRLVGKGEGNGYWETKTTLELISPTEMVEHIEQLDEGWLDKLVVCDFHWKLVYLSDKELFSKAHPGLPQWQSSIDPSPNAAPGLVDGIIKTGNLITAIIMIGKVVLPLIAVMLA